MWTGITQFMIPIAKSQFKPNRVKAKICFCPFRAFPKFCAAHRDRAAATDTVIRDRGGCAQAGPSLWWSRDTVMPGEGAFKLAQCLAQADAR